MVIPPSIRPSKGLPYFFESGGPEDLLKPSQLPLFEQQLAKMKATEPINEREGSSRLFYQGERNAELFHRALRFARVAAGSDDLERRLMTENAAICVPPLGKEEVLRIASSAWGYEVTGRNFVGGEPFVRTPLSRVETLKDAPDAFLLDTLIRFKHERVRQVFAASPKAMAQKGVVPGWRDARYRYAIRQLVERGIWELVRRGGHGPGDPHIYALSEADFSRKGTNIDPNTN
jgi:hypothetical protein